MRSPREMLAAMVLALFSRPESALFSSRFLLLAKSSERLMDGAKHFSTSSRQLARKMWWQKMRVSSKGCVFFIDLSFALLPPARLPPLPQPRIFVGIALLVVIIVVVLLVEFGGSKKQ